MKMLFYYSKQIFKYNLLISIIATSGIVSLTTHFSYNAIFSILQAFVIIYLTVGYFFSVYLYHYFSKNEYPLYYNAGFKIWHCIFITYGIHLVLLLLLFGAIIFLSSIIRSMSYEHSLG